MAAYYNEFKPEVAHMLRQLIKDKLIADGDVDERSILDVKADDLKGYTQCHFFAGIGGWSVALRLSGWGDDRPVWTGSCPCQPFSTAGKQKGASDERNLWAHWFRLIRECCPATIFGEQVANAITFGWLDEIFNDLEKEAYTCAAAVLPACSVGKPHRRDRLWFVGYSRLQRQTFSQEQATGVEQSGESLEWIVCPDGKTRPVKRGIPLLAHGIQHRTSILHAFGNAIVPQVAAEFIKSTIYQESVR